MGEGSLWFTIEGDVVEPLLEFTNTLQRCGVVLIQNACTSTDDGSATELVRFQQSAFAASVSEVEFAAASDGDACARERADWRDVLDHCGRWRAALAVNLLALGSREAWPVGTFP